uniref:Uncharacterized protein n=1 Tax=Trichinella nativa TaxID=6335 RepID=A0A0V1KIC2_9BILA
MTKSLKNVKNEKCTLKDLEYGTWNKARKQKIMENEKLPIDYLKNDKITEKHEK